MLRKSGFILKDYLLSLLVVMTLLPIIIASLRLVVKYDYFDTRIQDELSILHLRQKLILAEDFDYNYPNLSFTLEEREWTLYYDGKRLYLSPGYQLFIDDVEELKYIFSEGMVLLNYVKEGKEYTRYLTKG